MDLGLQGATVLISGGSQGVGRAAANLFAAEGCDLVLVARTAADLERARDEITAAHDVSVRIAAMDLTDPTCASSLAADFPEVGILVNNAGSIPAGGLLEVSEADWRHGWDLKVFGFFALTRAFYPLMKARKSGVIVNVMGASGARPGPRTIAIGTANASLNAFTRALGGASAEDGIRVVGVNPGAIATERGIQIRRARAEMLFGDAERWRELASTMPFGRAAEPEEVAAAVVFLASPRAAYTTGTILEVDGGIAAKVQGY